MAEGVSEARTAIVCGPGHGSFDGAIETSPQAYFDQLSKADQDKRFTRRRGGDREAARTSAVS
jgi:heme/copper-type cytochrome/quinol oxidase subunit 2